MKYPCNSRDKCSPYEVKFSRGLYSIELWGASSSVKSSTVAKGAYTKGTIFIKEETTFYIHIGASVGLYNSLPPYATTPHGNKAGGATDIRCSPLDYYLFDSLKTRIMVAAGSGTWEDHSGTGMNAGGLVGEDGNTTYTTSYRIAAGATQTNGGNIINPYNFLGKFGFAGYVNGTSDYGGMGGGGYYGGTSVKHTGASGGGSSFISGHEGCDAIFENSTEENISHSHQPNHYSGLVFFDTIMKGGNEMMPQPLGGKLIGYEGNGVAKITPLLMIDYCRTCLVKRPSLSFVFYIILVMLS